MLNKEENIILEFLKNKPKSSSKYIFDNINSNKSYATIKRQLSNLVDKRLLEKIGKGKGTKYVLSTTFDLFRPIDVAEYFGNEIDERKAREKFNLSLISETLQNVNLFTEEELIHLNELQNVFTKNISDISDTLYKKEFERLAIDLSWKSSQIEGNTYSLLEAESLLKEKETAAGKTISEAVMLLNHKEALDFIFENPNYLIPLSVAKIEDIHSLLTKELGVDRNIRKRRVGISGTNYKPLDNEFQIRETLENICKLVNQQENIFEKALLLLVLISYLQAFNDGNKRTARILSNVVLINFRHCPISFRTVNSIEYKKAMLIFYEQNNINAFKQIFINQFEFAVNTYF